MHLMSRSLAPTMRAVLLPVLCASAALQRPQRFARRSGDAAMSVTPLGAAVEPLLALHKPLIDELAARTAKVREPEHDEQWLLRFALENSDVDAAEAAVKQAQKRGGPAERQLGVLEWRRGEGRQIVEAAAAAYAAATAGGGWDNEAALSAAPHAELIRPFIGADQIQTIPSADGGYLCYVIRAAAIDDTAMMSALTTEQLTQFFVYAKELNARVALARTAATGKLVGVVLANDLSGVKLFGASAFRDALSAASKQTAAVYPGVAGPTLLLNLPPLLGALVKAFTPLFPKQVLERLRFESGPLKDVDDLSQLLRPPPGGSNPVRDQFLADVDRLVSAP